jgi:hypothetical protein
MMGKLGESARKEEDERKSRLKQRLRIKHANRNLLSE